MVKTKYSSTAKKRRFCELCSKKLLAEEVVICEDCYHSSVQINGGGDQ